MYIMKNLVSDWRATKDKHERVYLVGNVLNDLVVYMLSKAREDNVMRNNITKIMLEKNFSRAVLKNVEDHKEDIDPRLVTVIYDLIANVEFAEEPKDEQIHEIVQERYINCINMIINERAVKIIKKTKQPQSVVVNLLMQCPMRIDFDKLGNKDGYFYIKRLIRNCYFIPNFMGGSEEYNYSDTFNFTNLINYIIGNENLIKFAITVLLEPLKVGEKLDDTKKPIWNMLTDSALLILADLDDKYAIADVLETGYVKRRQWEDGEGRNWDTDRRLKLVDIKREDYSKIAKAVDILRQKSSYKKYLN